MVRYVTHLNRQPLTLLLRETNMKRILIAAIVATTLYSCGKIHDYRYKIVTDSGTYYCDSFKVKHDTVGYINTTGLFVPIPHFTEKQMDSMVNQFPNHSKLN